MAAADFINEFWPEWTIEEQIGSDSFATVYRASRKINNKVFYSAIKVVTIPNSSADLEKIMADGADMQSVCTYYQKIVDDCVEDISLMMEMRGSSNIVSVEDYYVREYPDETKWEIYIRMEYLTSLSSWLPLHPLDEKGVCELGKDICRALTHFEKRGIIHRDIRPDNIFISQGGEYKLGNFGLPRRLSQSNDRSASIDVYDYMAPELFLQENYDSTIDLYSLGIILYEALNSSQMPFIEASAKDVTVRDKEQALSLRLTTPYLPAPANASTEMSIAILQACRYDPAQRYQSAMEMSMALDSVLHSVPANAGISPIPVTTTFAQNSRDIPQGQPEYAPPEVPVPETGSASGPDGQTGKNPHSFLLPGILALGIAMVIIGYLITPFIFKIISGSAESESTDSIIAESTRAAFPTEPVAQTETLTLSPTPTLTPTSAPAQTVTPTPTTAPTKTPSPTPTSPPTAEDVVVIDQSAQSKSQEASSVDGIVYIADVYEYLTLRNAPSTSAAAICLLPPYTELYITEFTNDPMVKVITIGTGFTGYVNRNYLAKKGSATIRAGKSSQQASASDPIYYADVYDYLTLRNAPSTSAGEIDRLLPFTAMRVHSRTNGMAYVTVVDTSQTGYVNTDYIVADPSQAKRAGKSSSPVNMTTHGFSVGNYCFADVNEYLTLRTAPDTSASEIARLPDDTMLVILELTNSKMMKVYVVPTGQIGYVNRNYVK